MRRPAWSQDPAAPSLTLFASLVAIGFAAIGLGWRVAARTIYVGLQVPALVSGGMGGLALILIGSGLANVQAGRRLAASERADTDLLLEEASQLVEAFKNSRT